MKFLTVLLAALALSGCGSIVTVFKDDHATGRHLKTARSDCGAVPRVYSGVMFDFCMLYAQPSGHPETKETGFSMPGLFLDMAASGVVDTLVLPYTIYRQNRDGSIEVGWSK